MTKSRFAKEFMQEAVRQVVERGYTVSDVARRLGVSVQSPYKWVEAKAEIFDYIEVFYNRARRH